MQPHVDVSELPQASLHAGVETPGRSSGSVLMNLTRLFVASTVIASVGPALPIDAAPTVSVSSSTTQARKGEPFHVYVEVTTQEDIEKLDFAWTEPTGFKVERVAKQVPDALGGGASLIVDLLVTPPGFSWYPYTPGSDTREQKVFVFNISYTIQVNGQPKRLQQATKLTVPYPLGGWLYVFTGILGLILGNVVKTLTAHKKELVPPTWQKVSDLVLKQELFGLLTSVAIGFVVLLVLARTEIPTKGWYDSIALGVTLAILADDQLLTKLKGP